MHRCDLFSISRIFKIVLSTVPCWDLKRCRSTYNKYHNCLLSKSLHWSISRFGSMNNLNFNFILFFTTMNNHNLFYEINRIYWRTTLRLIRRHERCSSKLARYTNHLTFLTRCIKNRVVPKDLRVRPPVPTKGAHRIAALSSMRFLRERIRLTHKAKGDAKKNTESIAQSITSAPSTNDANRILEQIKTNTNESSTPPKTDISRKTGGCVIDWYTVCWQN